MPKLKLWMCSLLLAVVSVTPALAGTKDGTDAKKSADTTANTASANPVSVNPVSVNPVSSSPASSSPAAQPAAAANPNLTPAAGSADITALLGVLVMKGVLAPSEANSIRNAAPEAELRLLLDALARKGVVSAADLRAAAAEHAAPTAAAPPVTATVASPAVAPVASSVPAVTASVAAPIGAPISAPISAPVASAVADPEPQTTASASPAPAPAVPTPAVAPAITPLKVLPVDPPVKDGLNAAFKMGGVKMTPYGFIKATAAYDSSSPNGDDFPFVGLFLGSTAVTNTGPTKDPEFHLKARSTRIGANIEWPDISSKIVLTGRIEGDYEGNFSEVDNRDVSSIRSNAFQLRLAWARLDYNISDSTDVYFEGGQDWSIFGSSILPPILETTFLQAYYGAIWERTPQFQFGLVQKVGGSRNFKISPTFAIMMPTSSQIEKLGSLGLEGQLAQAEREGADSGRPEIEGRLVFQWQLDPAKGVAPAQFLWSGFQGRRTSIASSSNGPYCQTGGCFIPTASQAAYYAANSGFTVSSTMYGNQLGLQLPTRWFTVVASAYSGGDMRFFFGGQVNSYYTDMGGLTNPVVYTTLDGGPLTAAGGAVLAINSAGQVVVAPQKPIRSFGGFISLGLPLSRWANANPKGHNAGWQLYFTTGKDQVNNKDLNNPNATQIACATGVCTGANSLSPLPLAMGKMFAATLNYKLNPWITFSYEQSIYATRLLDGVPGYTIAGKASNEWQDHRSEFGPTFTF